MSGYVQSNQIVQLPSDNVTIVEADTGKIMITPQTAGVSFVYTLPALKNGLHYRFINGAAAALNGNVSIQSTAINIYGSVINGPTNGIAFTAVNQNQIIRFVSAQSLVGDYIDLICDGTRWYVEARSRVAAGIGIA